MIRRARVLVGALGLTVVMGVGLVGPASAASITPIKPINPAAPSTPVKPPPPAPKGPSIPFKGLTPKQIKDKAVKNARRAKTVHVQGVILGQNERMTIDGTFSKTAAKLTVTSNLQGSVTFLTVGARTFMSADAKFLLSSNDGSENDLTPTEAAQLAGAWFEITGNSQSLRDLRSEMTAATWVDGAASFNVKQRVAGKKIGGKKTVGLYEPGSAGGTLYVSASGATYPLGAESADKSVVLTYSRWNAKVNLTAPATVGSLPF